MLKLKVKMRIAAALVALIMVLSFSAAQAADTAKNVILMISDGWGYNQIQATNFWNGATLESYEKFPVKLAMTTYSASTPNNPAYSPIDAWSNFNYVKTGATDSASAATAMATGFKNYDGVLNISTTGQKLKTITEIAYDYKKSSGVVSTVEWSHATPAGMFAHNASRNNYAAIANEMLGDTSPLNVIMGAGNPLFNDNGVARTPVYYPPPPPTANNSDWKYVGGEATWNSLTSNSHPQKWSLIQELADFNKLANNDLTSLTNKDKVVGTFKAATTAQQARGGDPLADPGVVPFNSNVPTLSTMSTGALNLLNQDKDGFFLMIEGGAVDWANHANQLGRLIEEQTDFNKAVDSVINWVKTHSSWEETLLIVTGDHECGYLWGPTPGGFNALVDNGPGVLPGASYNSDNHTNSLIPLFAMGANADMFYDDIVGIDTFRGAYIDNTRVHGVMASVITAPIPGSFMLFGTSVMAMLIMGLRRKVA